MRCFGQPCSIAREVQLNEFDFMRIVFLRLCGDVAAVGPTLLVLMRF
jgi:hypothetical protein